MRFVTGGAFNGKAQWVREQTWWREEEGLWLSAYKKDPLIQDFRQVTVIEGLEQYIREDVLQKGEEASSQWRAAISRWLEWEGNAHGRRLVLIGSDISKGIVPIEAENRIWRDVTGWIYQEIMRKSVQADLIWYGIRTTLK
ncbi:bifunctional adenosylcobinamide kinase/adenosylcobinamide-phosphate guanylyltransferase [Metabacillus sp. KIGAM252]|uniref:Bifunctional adenosylcobinamide kinase/adenosylcobinamide-phosphate guanylyltransferase n=1 Tax=Metabacillus flavus TaxID=2823519 RepID=A0ABS5LDD3_9BACI|nr:bifunctional adenosylcobinamide kinase/adenosylcobinamide-phosphate guanylyltransferase [Metabacillus flavus]MBS2968711.1 bifunctional adenosylcobinamide kinase/adenosylcobinamide-phosphate guanylyltransferase [Metabacillus flavus]